MIKKSQKPKLGGRYTGITHSLHIMVAGYLYILVQSLEWFSNEREMIFGEVLSKNRFCAVTKKIRTHSQNVILSCQFLSMCPRLLSNFRQLNTFWSEQWKIFVKFDFCTAVRIWQISVILLFCVSVCLHSFVFALFLS